jgi:MFS family permease
LLAGLTAFAACSTWAAFSGSVGSLIAARASMGIGAALIMPSTLAIITSTFTVPRERQRAISLWAATSGAGIALGPIVGGLLLEHFWWGSVFLINVPIAVAGFAFALPFVPDSKNPSAQRPDLVGSLLSIAGLGLLLYAIIEAPAHGLRPASEGSLSSRPSWSWSGRARIRCSTRTSSAIGASQPRSSRSA